MDTAVSPAIAATQARMDAVGMNVLKKANEVEPQSALQLVEASTSNLPNHLGRNVNTLA